MLVLAIPCLANALHLLAWWTTKIQPMALMAAQLKVYRQHEKLALMDHSGAFLSLVSFLVWHSGPNLLHSCRRQSHHHLLQELVLEVHFLPRMLASYLQSMLASVAVASIDPLQGMLVNWPPLQHLVLAQLVCAKLLQQPFPVE
jgi:hypothetical protein